MRIAIAGAAFCWATVGRPLKHGSMGGRWAGAGVDGIPGFY